MHRKIPGSCGCPVVSDRSYEFVMDPVNFVESRIKRHSSRLFQARVLNNPTIFVCSPLLVKELLAGENCDDFHHGYRSILHHVFGDMIIFENEIDALHLRGCLAPVFERLHSHTENTNKFRDTYIASLGPRIDPVPIYSEFKTLMTRMCLELFLGLNDETPDAVIDEISELATQHWHGMISVPVRVNLPFGARSSYSLAVQAKDQLLVLIRDILARRSPANNQENSESLFSELRKVVFPKSDNLEQHILLFVSALIPKAFSSIITSFLLVMAGDEKDYAVFYISYAAHRDPSIFPDPEQFNPDRWSTCNKSHRDLIFSFGMGRRRCIGTTFMRSILLDVMRHILRLYDWSLSPSNQSLDYKFLPVARPRDDVTMLFQPLSAE